MTIIEASPNIAPAVDDPSRMAKVRNLGCGVIEISQGEMPPVLPLAHVIIFDHPEVHPN